jgi:hypothetical protein
MATGWQKSFKASVRANNRAYEQYKKEKDKKMQGTHKGHPIQAAWNILLAAGFKDVTEEANKQNKRTDFAAFEDPGGIGVHYCEFDYDIVELALDQELWA